MKPQTAQGSRPDSRQDTEPEKVPSAGSRYTTVSRWDAVRWFLATLLVVAVAALVVAVGLTRPAAAQKPQIGRAHV